MDVKKRVFVKRLNKSSYTDFVLAGDVGGTNANLALCGIKKGKPHLVFSMHTKTRTLRSLVPFVSLVLEEAKKTYGVVPTYACIGGAGPVSPEHDYCKLTNAPLAIDAKKIKAKTSLKHVRIINDFEAIGYGINFIDSKKDVISVRNRNARPVACATRTVLGAGTGLGISILVYDYHLKAYIPIPSEGSHTDFSAYTSEEQAFVTFAKKRLKRKVLTYDAVVSGTGIKTLYAYVKSLKGFKPTQYTREIDRAAKKTRLIAKYRTKDKTCKVAYDLFIRYYGRCARNFALETYSVGGIYIAGGIAAKDPKIFSTKHFAEEFTLSEQHTTILKKIPIHVITNYDVSLYGAAYAAWLTKTKKQRTVKR